MKNQCRICGDYECADEARCHETLASPDAYALTHPSEDPIRCPHCGEDVVADVTLGISCDRSTTGELISCLEVRLPQRVVDGVELDAGQEWLARFTLRDDSDDSSARFNETMARRALDQLARAILEHLIGDRLRDVFRHLSEKENEESS